MNAPAVAPRLEQETNLVFWQCKPPFLLNECPSFNPSRAGNHRICLCPPSLCPPCTTLQPFIRTLLLIGQPFPTPAFLPTSAVPVHLRSIRRLPPTHHPFFHLGSCQMGAFSFPNQDRSILCLCTLPILAFAVSLAFLKSHVLCKQSNSENCRKRSRAGTLDTAQHG